jgi:hypothetical protein
MYLHNKIHEPLPKSQSNNDRSVRELSQLGYVLCVAKTSSIYLILTENSNHELVEKTMAMILLS